MTAHIAHLKQPDGCYFKVITVATRRPEKHRDTERRIQVAYRIVHHEKRSDIGAAVMEQLSDHGWGVALCSHNDNCNRKRGRILAKGRLLKIIRGKIK